MKKFIRKLKVWWKKNVDFNIWGRILEMDRDDWLFCLEVSLFNLIVFLIMYYFTMIF